ncbi:MAG: sigma 54-interacting transcriptional regulator [Gammaproteobacteria bacterium]
MAPPGNSSPPGGQTRSGAHVLIVDDDPGLLRLLSLRLESAGYEVDTADSGSNALQRVAADRPDLVISDLRMDGMDGLALLDQLGRRAPGLPVLMITAHGTIPDAVSATQHGAFGFLTKPIDKDELMAQVQRAVALSANAAEADTWRDQIITRSPVMEELLTQARRVAETPAGVLVLGQSGSGKELLARAIHVASRRPGEFVKLNCGAVTEEKFESELFGDAVQTLGGAGSVGLMRQAEGGTLFLDEVGDMPLAQQVRLLRALQDKRVRPVGGDGTVNVDVRVIAASHRDLKAAVKAGEFREDLYYRLNVVELSLPPLASRREDVPLLVSHKLSEIEAQGRPRQSFSPQAMELLTAAPWPGNVRQLFNVIEKTTALASGPVVSTRLVSTALGEDFGAMPSFAEAQEAFTRDYLIRLLRLSEGNVSKAARLAKRNRTDFYRLLARHDVDWARFKREAKRA